MTNKTVLITGCSSGIGRLTALHFHERGWNVVATLRKPEEENQLNNLKNVLVNRIDVTDHISIAISIGEAMSRFKKVDVVVNNAGYGCFGLLEATTIEKIRRQFEVNVIGSLAVIKGVLPYFRKQGEGTLINVSSMGGKVSFPLGTVYHGSKFALEGISEALYYELKNIGVRVKMIEPGMMSTNFGGRSLDLNLDPIFVEYRSFVEKVMAKMGQMGRSASHPQSVAEMIYKAATDDSRKLRYVVGDDAKAWITARNNMDDSDLIDSVRNQFELSGM